MSLINQMLRDLQDQKKSSSTREKKAASPGKMERIPYLPLPVVLGGVGLVIVLLIWWLAGALSEMMFGFEPSPQQAPQVASQPAASEPVTPQEEVKQEPVADQLTDEERVAEPVVAMQPVEQKAASSQAPVSVTPVQNIQEPVRQKPKPIKEAVKKPVPVKRVAKQPVKKVVAAAPKKRSIKRAQQKAPAVQKAERLHPDDLPGAIRTAPLVEVAPADLIGRPSRTQSSTPYGLAEEAYLDGLWALERQRSALAVRSLQHALEIYPGHLQAREVLSDIFYKGGQSGEAILLLTEGLEIAPDYIDFKKRYARMMIKQGDYDAAAKVLLQNGLPGVKEDPEAHTILASLYQKLDEHFLAAQTYRNLLVVWPSTGAFWVGLGSALEGQNLPKDAVDCYRRALKTDNLREDLSRYAKRRLKLLKQG